MTIDRLFEVDREIMLLIEGKECVSEEKVSLCGCREEIKREWSEVVKAKERS